MMLIIIYHTLTSRSTTVVGCEKCVNEWYSGPDALIETCPSCHGERGYNETVLLRGFDDFITEVQKVIQTQAGQ